MLSSSLVIPVLVKCYCVIALKLLFVRTNKRDEKGSKATYFRAHNKSYLLTKTLTANVCLLTVGVYANLNRKL